MTKADPFFFCHQRILQRVVQTSLEEQLDPPFQLLLDGGPMASLGDYVPVFLKKPIVSYDFQGRGWSELPSHPPAHTLDPPMIGTVLRRLSIYLSSLNCFDACEQQRRRPASALLQSSQSLCYSLYGKHNI